MRWRYALLPLVLLATPIAAQVGGGAPPPPQPAPPPPPPAPAPAPPPMQPLEAVMTMCFTDGVQCFTNAPYRWTIGSTAIAVEVPAGFVTDFASIPVGLRNLFERHGRYSRAAIIHDFLYWTQRCTRAQADNLFLIAMVEDGVRPAQRRMIHQAVRLGAGGAWRSNADERAAGLPRVVPAGQAFRANAARWSDARAALRDAGAVDPAMPVDPRACAIGDRTVVP